MDDEVLLASLNPEQKSAVTHPASDLLVLAGAGSGKTTVLVSRIAFILKSQDLSPQSILAVTFTNKAAKQMQERIADLMERPVTGMWVGTFHGLAHRMLRQHAQEAHLPSGFSVMDSEDQIRLIKRVIKQLELDEEQFPAKPVQSYINAKKDEGLRARHVEVGYDFISRTHHAIYQEYEATCQRMGTLDFAEILLRSHELLKENPDILNYYQQRFSHIFVDEFQDTNDIQYAWLKTLAGAGAPLTIVGDDDQSIYGWRGAKENIQTFTRDFPHAAIIRLEQNYRSTKTILEAANHLIRFNSDRLGKELWTACEDDDPIDFYSAFNESDEAHFVINQIKQWKETHGSYSDTAILYRSNAQSRVLEEALIRAHIPYRIFGGFRFFERAEIKDVLAYLRLLDNLDDDVAFERVINLPARGIGERTLEEIRGFARTQEKSLWEAAKSLLADGFFPARAGNALQAFIALIENLQEQIVGQTLEEQVTLAIENTGLLAHYRAQKGEKAQGKVENIEELLSAAQQFELPSDQENFTPLQAFLAHAALEAGDGQADEHTDSVQMMTLHSAKGLEFPLVCLTGLEDGLFPHDLSLLEPGRLAEERRLCYVGMTRAMKKLIITFAESRKLYGRQFFHKPSRFLKELPPHCLRPVRTTGNHSRDRVFLPFTRKAPLDTPAHPFKLGTRVKHAKFGEGIVTQCEGDGEHARVQVNFKRFGVKWLDLGYAKLVVA